jgi:hypothetical protein
MGLRKEVRARLALLEPIAADLNKQSDALTAELKAIETELAKLNVGVEVELDEPFHHDHKRHEYDDQTQEFLRAYVPEYYLAYAKTTAHGKEWRILVRRLDREKNHTREEWVLAWQRPLVDVARELRMVAAGQIGSLLDKIRETAKGILANLKKISETDGAA